MNFKKNDKVIILTGDYKGKTGEIKEVLPAKNKVVVVGINMVSKHVKPTQKTKGGIQKIEAPINASNVAVVCQKCKKSMTPKKKVLDNGSLSRVCRKCEAVIM